MTHHPTWLELDALHLGADDQATQVHVSACSACGRYLERLREPAVLPLSTALALRPGPRLASRKGSIVIAALAAAVLLNLGWGLRAPEVRAKAAPSVMVHARQGQRVSIWDGHSPFAAGDAVRFEVATGDFEFVTIVTAGPSGRWLRLYEGRHAAPGAVLPSSLRFDDSGGDEVVVVVFSDGPLDERALAAAADSRTPAGGLFVTRFLFPRGKTP